MVNKLLHELPDGELLLVMISKRDDAYVISIGTKPDEPLHMTITLELTKASGVDHLTFALATAAQVYNSAVHKRRVEQPKLDDDRQTKRQRFRVVK